MAARAFLPLALLGILLTSIPAHAQDSRSLEVGTLQLDLLTGSAGSKIISTSGKVGQELLKSPQVSTKQVLELSFKVTADGKEFKPRQVFLSFQHISSGANAVVVAKSKKDGSHTISAAMAALITQVGMAGDYKATLLVGDVSATKSIAWDLGKLELVLEEGQTAAPAQRTVALQADNNMKPVITHMFRAPDKRPPAMVSLVFTGLAVTPLVAVVGYVLFGIGINFRAWPKDSVTGLAALGFHGVLAVILGVYLLFWTQWNLVQTLPVVLALGVLLFLAGYKALSGLATERFNSKKD